MNNSFSIEQSRVVTLLKSMVAIPSLSFEEKPLADFLAHYLLELGIQSYRKADNIWVTFGEGKKRLLLNSHLDVVPASENHPFSPFQPTVDEGKLYGRGAVDAKASGASMLMALIELIEEGFSPNGEIIVALTACEEHSKLYNGLEDVLPELLPIHGALVGEPTEFQPCVGQKGLLILKLIEAGKTAHAARGHLGINAIKLAAQDILTLSNFYFEKEDSFLGKPTLHPTIIEGGTVHNVIPDSCTITLDIRSTPAYTHSEIAELIDAQVQASVQVYSDRIIPVSTSIDSQIVQSCLKALPNAKPFGSPTTSDWIFLQGIPTVKIGPGQSELSHTPQEHIPLLAVVEAVEGYKTIIKAFFADE